MPPASRQPQSVAAAPMSAAPLPGSGSSAMAVPRGSKDAQACAAKLGELRKRLEDAASKANAAAVGSVLAELDAVPLTPELFESTRVLRDLNAIRERMKASPVEGIRNGHANRLKILLKRWNDVRGHRKAVSPGARKGPSPLTPRTPSSLTAPASPAQHVTSTLSVPVSCVPSPAPSDALASSQGSSQGSVPMECTPAPAVPSRAEIAAQQQLAAARRRCLEGACAPEGLVAGVDGCFAVDGECAVWHAWSDSFSSADVFVASYALPF
eukprot:Opistho-1_new@108301